MLVVIYFPSTSSSVSIEIYLTVLGFCRSWLPAPSLHRSGRHPCVYNVRRGPWTSKREVESEQDKWSIWETAVWLEMNRTRNVGIGEEHWRFIVLRAFLSKIVVQMLATAGHKDEPIVTPFVYLSWFRYFYVEIVQYLCILFGVLHRAVTWRR